MGPNDKGDNSPGYDDNEDQNEPKKEEEKKQVPVVDKKIEPQPGQKMSALDRLKQVQQAFKMTWQGIHTEYTGRPGTCTICNTKRVFHKPEQLTIEEERSFAFEQMF